MRHFTLFDYCIFPFFFPVTTIKEQPMQLPNGPAEAIRLHLSLSLSPLISFAGGPTVATTAVSQPLASTGPVQVTADMALRLSLVSQVANGYLGGRRINLSEGLLSIYVIVGKIEVWGNENGLLKVSAAFSGSFRGRLTITGSPVYNGEEKTVVLLHPQYQLESKNLLLQGARRLFARRIENELKKATVHSLAALLEKAQKMLNDYLNKEWTKGLVGTGETNGVRLTRLKVETEHLLLQASAEAHLRVTLDPLMLNL